MMHSSFETDEFSFMLKPSHIINGGVGVFTTHEIAEGIKIHVVPKDSRSRQLKGHQIPDIFKDHCIAEENDWYRCPLHFNRMEIGWYINHSFSPNIEKRHDGFYTMRLIAAGEEIVMDYNSLNEPENKKAPYYIQKSE